MTKLMEIVASMGALGVLLNAPAFGEETQGPVVYEGYCMVTQVRGVTPLLPAPAHVVIRGGANAQTSAEILNQDGLTYRVFAFELGDGYGRKTGEYLLRLEITRNGQELPDSIVAAAETTFKSAYPLGLSAYAFGAHQFNCYQKR